MKMRDISSLSAAEEKEFIDRIPYLKDLKLSDYGQFNLLLAHSKLITLNPGEVLLHKGKVGKKIYFLGSGHLDVFSEAQPGHKALNQLTTGEIIGALSIINDQPRTATLAASTGFAAEKTQVIATDFRVFGDLHDFSEIKLQTKVSLLRVVINNIRFKLAKYQAQYPEHRLAKKQHSVDRYTGESNTAEELDSLAGQAFVLTHLLNSWNKETDSSVEVPQIEVKVSNKDKILGFFGKKRA